MLSIQDIRKMKELLRKKVKNKLLFPRVFEHKKSQDQIIIKQKNIVKVDKRCFQNIFELQEKIGQGTNGFVHKCIQIRTGKTYAVKICEGDAQFVRIVKQTYQILKMFDNDKIIKGKCCFINENTQQIYLVMEYSHYPPLSKVMQQSQFSQHQIKQIIQNLLEAVNLLHQSNVCHRDIKPQNILYDLEKNKLKIIDLGISKAMYNRRTQQNQPMWTVTGSQYYKAPQMLNGMAYNEKVDVWAIGVIAYQLLFGKLPFYSQYISQVIDQILEKQPEFLSTRANVLDIDFIKALLKKNPKQRLSCAEALRHPWIQPQVKFKKSDDLSSSQNIYTKFQPFSRKFSPSISTLLINHLNINTKQLMDTTNGIIQIQKDMDINNWVSLKRSNSVICSSSAGDDSFKQNPSSIEYEMNMIGLDQ